MERAKRLLMVFPLELAAHHLRCLELCRRLKEQFDIQIAYSSKYKGLTSNLGLKTFKVENFDPEEIRRKTPRFDFSWLNLRSIRGILDSQTEVINRNEPDIVLGDASFTLKMAAERTNTKFVSLLNGYMTKYYRFTRKISRSHPGYQYSRKMPSRFFELLTRLIENASFKKIHEPFRKIRKEMGLSSQKYFLDELEGERNLVCDLPELFPQKNLPPNYEFVGPLFYRGSDMEKELLDFIGDHHPNILVSMGSTGSWEKVSYLNNPIFGKYRIIASGDASSTLNGTNIMSKPFVNHIAIMPKIDLMICHGGNGTIYQALAFGVPVLCVPYNLEQEWNACRVEEMGLGIRLDELSEVDEIQESIKSWIRRRADASFARFKGRIKSFSATPVEIEIASRDRS